MRRNRLIMAAVILFALLAGLYSGYRLMNRSVGGQQEAAGTDSQGARADKNRKKKAEKDEKESIEEGREEETQVIRTPVRVEHPGFTRISRQEIQISWSDEKNPYVARYRIMKRKSGESTWQSLGTLDSDGAVSGRELSFLDILEDSTLQQSEYRVDVKVKDEDLYEGVEGTTVFASNILVCIDPGHYKGQNLVDDGETVYAEGDFTLELSRELQKILEGTYGITVSLTRESGRISLGGYTDGELDGGYISLRGEYAKGSDLFLSMHTNANQEGANGYETISQPVEIMKPVILANDLARESQTALDIGNAVGLHLAETSSRLGIASPGKFTRADSREDLAVWTDEWNDSLKTSGTICYRTGDDGQDYYGVLRGASVAGVPGLIIEHGFHTVPEMRRLAAEGVLKTQWAMADAAGIAEGFSLERVNE